MTHTDSYAYGIYMDSNKLIVHLNDGEYPNDALKQFFHMVYNELSRGEDYKQQIFQVKKALQLGDNDWIAGREMKEISTLCYVWRTVCIILAALLVFTTAELVYSNLFLTVSRYVVRSEKVTGTIRVVLLSDLHGRRFGMDNCRLLDKIAVQEPDLIALVGDIFNHDAADDEVNRMCGFIQSVSEIAPVYFGLGNHEVDYIWSNDITLLERIQQSGAVVLESEYLDVEIDGIPIRIGGYMGYYRRPFMTTRDSAQQEREIFFADAFEASERFKLLLNHVPTVWLDWNNLESYPVDLVLSGHYHGGLIRIPFLEQGLIAPNNGWFPPYTKGLFEGRETACVLTTGLAGSKLPRFFNQPEIAVVDIVPAD